MVQEQWVQSIHVWRSTMSRYFTDGRWFETDEEFRVHVEKKKNRRIEKMIYAIQSVKYSSVENVECITEKEFYEDLQHISNIVDINECIGIEKGMKMYSNLYNKDGFIVNSSTSSTPAMDTYYSQLIFKYKTEYYRVSMVSTN